MDTLTQASSTKALAKTEVARYLRHPVFLVGAALWTLTIATAINHRSEDIYGPAVIPAFFLGVFGMVIGFRLTRSMERSAEAVETVPMPVASRVAALLATSVVPAVLGLVSCVLILTVTNPKADFAYGTWSSADRFAIMLGQSLVAGAGGALLGVAAARWLRFPGAVVVAPLAVVTWVIVGNGWTANNQDSTVWLAARLFSPFAFFTTLDTDKGPHRVESWRGNPWFYLLWLVLLCALAAVVALLKDAEGAARATLTRALVVVVVAALASFALAVTTGPSHATVRSPQGVSRI